MDQLFLMEVLVENLFFVPAVGRLPQKKQINIFVTFGTFASLEVRSEALAPDPEESDSKKREVNFNSGKSYLFPSKAQDIITALNQCPLEVSVATKTSDTPIGVARIPWSSDFVEMVQSCEESAGYITPASIRDIFPLKDKTTDELVGEIELFVRLSGFGKNIQTQFQVMQKEGKDGGPSAKQYLFKSTNVGTTFLAQKYGMGTSSEVLPVGPLYQTSEQATVPKLPRNWETLYNASRLSKSSIANSAFNIDAISTPKSTEMGAPSESDIVSLKFRPEEHKYTDVRALDATAHPHLSGEISPVSSNVSKLEVDLETTAEQINKFLCKNRDCPGVQKFKEFGIGPLATGKGLGTIYGPTTIPVSYGLSHTYGNLDNYGPYGLYSRPKTLHQPFVPKKDAQEDGAADSSTPNKNDNKKTCKHMKPEKQTCKHVQPKSCCADSDPLRLSGGSPTGDDNGKIKNPMRECKELVQNLDKVLSDYKKALGPCGQVTCPFAPNIVRETCKKVCGTDGNTQHRRVSTASAKSQPENQSAEAELECVEREENCDDLPVTLLDITCTGPPDRDNGMMSACGTPSCPYSRKPSLPTEEKFMYGQIKNACGAPSCPYTKNKLGTADDDDMMELQYLDMPSFGKSCGSPKCPFPLQTLPPLEPVHWDCPDPLPKGPCKNPECPFLPKELKLFKKPKGPCGSTACPYAPPPPCDVPTCPFNPPQPCPYGELNNKPSPCYFPETPSDVCKNVPCPYAPKKPVAPLCSNPKCPLAALRAKPSDSSEFCENPDCPFNKNQPTPCNMTEPADEICKNPDCPFAMSSSQSSNNEVCDNPTCPFAKNKSPSADICENPSCPFAKIPEPLDERCENPSCPFVTKKSSPCFIPPPSEAQCANPACPFAPKKPSPCYIPPILEMQCPNPACPFAEKKPSPPVCPSPTCPFSKPTENLCVYPECPFDPKPPNDICNDPLCPYALPPSCTCGPKPPPINAVCVNPRCPYTTLATCVTTTQPTCEFNTYEIGDNNTRLSLTYGEGKKTTNDVPPTEITANGKGKVPDHRVASTCDVQDECCDSKNSSTGSAPKRGSQSAPAIGQAEKTEPVATSSASEKVIKEKKTGKCKRKRKSQFVYGTGDQYPGVQIGHRECVMPGCNVPPNMGWLWNVKAPGLKARRGWKPGAIGRLIAERIQQHREEKGLKMLCSLENPKPSKKKLKKRGGTGYESDDSEDTVAPKPTIAIKKREGCYWITMNPLKDPKTLEDNENPYMDCTPMQFKIMKNKEDDEGRLCYCCEEELESSSSDSELDIEFTPPAGIIRPERLRRKKNVVHIDTQYNPDDFKEETVQLKKGNDQDKGKKDKGKKGNKGGKKGKGKKGKK